MTPEQRAALDALAAPAVLSADQLARIEQLLDPEARNDVAIAQVLSEGRLLVGDVRRMEIGFVGGYPLGPAAGDAVLGNLEAHAETAAPTARMVARALRAMRTEPGLNLGDPALHAILSALVPDPLTEQEAAAIRSMSLVPAPVRYQDVSAALNAAEGRIHMG